YGSLFTHTATHNNTHTSRPFSLADNGSSRICGNDTSGNEENPGIHELRHNTINSVFCHTN
ncbi:MAG: hypothetical protein OQK73_09725, partial [Gammaproteobacteria bacterium]|nr:hypothetical protein [Gammaproteobacteria bacterium]